MLLKTICLFIGISSAITVTVFALQSKKTPVQQKMNKTNAVVENNKYNTIIKNRATVLKNYIAKNGYNDSICFIINMAVASGKPRFYVYNLQQDSIEKKGLVTHGSGSEGKNGNFVFNNTPNSLASSKGKYKVGNSYYGKFGLAYKLYGLDATNNKAFERFVVLHSHQCVPSKAVHPLPICVSWGCPTVAPDFLTQLQLIISKSKKPILLDIGYMP